LVNCLIIKEFSVWSAPEVGRIIEGSVGASRVNFGKLSFKSKASRLPPYQGRQVPALMLLAFLRSSAARAALPGQARSHIGFGPVMPVRSPRPPYLFATDLWWYEQGGRADVPGVLEQSLLANAPRGRRSIYRAPESPRHAHGGLHPIPQTNTSRNRHLYIPPNLKQPHPPLTSAKPPHPPQAPASTPLLYAPRATAAHTCTPPGFPIAE